MANVRTHPHPVSSQISHPAVVELFTSQGCSSCPPADALLSRLALEQGPNRLLFLAFHVDYWDRIGWVDPFSQAAFTERQQEYALSLGLRNIYTPQAVIGGRNECVGSDANRLRAYMEHERARGRQAGLRMWASVEDRVAKVAIVVSAGPESRMWIAIAEDGLVTGVKRGENAGATLTNDAVVRVFREATLQNGTRDFALPPDMVLERAFAAVVVSDTQGGVLAAASHALITGRDPV